ncbi:Thiol:disulfide interchange protein DsbA [Dirofilaria immitis]
MWELQRYLSSPLLAGGNYWRANALKLEIGFRRCNFLAAPNNIRNNGMETFLK